MNFFSTTLKTTALPLFLGILLSLSGFLQIEYDKIVHPYQVFTTETRYILPTILIKNFSFGFNNILADLYWVRAIQDFSIWDGKDPFYLQEYKNIATLDPSFSYPYLLGILAFTSRSVNDRNATTTVLDTFEPVARTGIHNLPNNWEIPFYMGTGFQLTKRPEKALEYLKIAASHTDAPEIIHKVYTSYLTRTLTGDNAAKEFVKAIFDTTESKTTKKILENGIAVSNLTEILKSLTARYNKKYGFYPQSLNDLVEAKMIRPNTGLTDTFTIMFNPNNGDVRVNVKTAK